MATLDINEEYWTYKGRIASFQTASARRASTARGKGTKAIKWPHKFLAAETLSEAGFYFNPSQKENDNVTCFLCHKSICGWEEEDSPLDEHLKLSPDCGWAIVASIQARNEELLKEYPVSERMIEARKATFGGKWPHEQKKGWKCKTKQLVDAGWVYQPTPESDDWVTCTYCDLGLDGWEPADDPMDQHYKRNPECTFFTLINEHPEKAVSKKKTPKARKPRASKASRLSTQSNVTFASEALSFVDVPAEEDDSVLTSATSTTVTSQAARKMPKTAAKKAGGRKTKAKKEEPVEIISIPEPEDDDFEVKVAPKPKTTRGKKRNSDAMDESTMTVAEAPAPKRRATRTRASLAVHDQSTINDFESVLDTTEETTTSKPAPKKRGRPSKARSVSTASKASLRMAVPDDDELDAALEADLERHNSDDDVSAEVMDVDAPLNRRVSRSRKASEAPVRKMGRSSKVAKADHSMFNTEVMDIDDAAIEEELRVMEVEESQPLPKAKGVKAKSARKPSAKQTAAAKRAAMAEVVQGAETRESEDDPINLQGPEPTNETMAPPVKRKTKAASMKKNSTHSTRGSVMSEVETNFSDMSAIDITNLGDHDSGNETDASIASQSTVVKGGVKRRGSRAVSKAKGGKKATSRKIEEIVKPSAPQPETTAQPEIIEPEPILPPKKTAGRQKKTKQTGDVDMAESSQLESSVLPQEAVESSFVKTGGAKQAKAKANTRKKEPLEEVVTAKPSVEPVPTPRSPTPAPEEATPSLSPQSSDAENQPPSSKPSNSRAAHTMSRIPLAASTPVASPSKRNIIAGLQSNQSWVAVDLDEIFLKSPGDKENTGLLGHAVSKAKQGVLTSPEKKMTVAEWIQFNANLAEDKLKAECERMVNMFEREGGRAMRVLEGVHTVD